MSYIHKSIETGDVDEFNELLIEDLLDTVTDKRERENLGKILTKFNRTDMNRYFLKAVWKFLADHLE
jgi:calcineurin-like phosphoesterase family protein